jgi:hypothetical protein
MTTAANPPPREIVWVIAVRLCPGEVADRTRMAFDWILGDGATDELSSGIR